MMFLKKDEIAHVREKSIEVDLEAILETSKQNCIQQNSKVKIIKITHNQMSLRALKIVEVMTWKRLKK